MSSHDLNEVSKNRCVPVNPFQVDWCTDGKTFGTFYFYMKDGVLQCDSGTTNKEFVKQMICKMIDECKFKTSKIE